MSKIVIAVIAFACGLGAAVVYDKGAVPNEEAVRVALYSACVNGMGYTPKPSGLDYEKHPGCSRRNIDLLLAYTYGNSFIEPLPPAVDEYEKVILKYKK